MRHLRGLVAVAALFVGCGQPPVVGDGGTSGGSTAGGATAGGATAGGATAGGATAGGATAGGATAGGATAGGATAGGATAGGATAGGATAGGATAGGATAGGATAGGATAGGATAGGATAGGAAGGAGDAGSADAGPPLAHDGGPGDAGPCVTTAPTIPALRIINVNATASGAFATYAAQPPGSTDWYLVEQRGTIRIIRGGSFLATPFLDITALMGSNLGERGLLGLAFHPSYATNGRFFTFGVAGDNAMAGYGAINQDVVAEWRRDPTNPDRALPTKVRDIVVLPVSASNHNGGTIVFGPDNYLYFATGDGGGGCEDNKPGEVQDPTKLFGKVLRLDVDLPAPFAAPGNPFTNDARVYHYGLRNPYRFNFDPVTWDLYLGDVGQNSYEEISVSVANAPGRNFGWPKFEGAVMDTCSGKTLGGPSPHTPPIVSIDRRPGAMGPFANYASIIGGAVYRGTALPSLYGVYLFTDFYGNAMGALRHCGGMTYGPVAIPYSSITSPTSLAAVSAIVQGNDGELYVVYGFSGRIGRIAPL